MNIDVNADEIKNIKKKYKKIAEIYAIFFIRN